MADLRERLEAVRLHLQQSDSAVFDSEKSPIILSHVATITAALAHPEKLAPLSATGATSNYVADHEVFPQRIEFADGRVVKMRGSGHLFVCMKDDEQHQMESHHKAFQREAAEQETIEDVLEIVGSFGPYGLDVNDTIRHQIMLRDEVLRLRAAAPAPAEPVGTDDPNESGWTPEGALRFYAAGRHFDTVDGRTRILDTGSVASDALKALSPEYDTLKGNAPTSARVEAGAINWLASLKANSFTLSRNDENAPNYASAAEWIKENEEDFKDTPEADILAMIHADTIWTLQIYPDTPIGFYKWHRATMAEVIEAARSSMKPGSQS